MRAGTTGERPRGCALFLQQCVNGQRRPSPQCVMPCHGLAVQQPLSILPTVCCPPASLLQIVFRVPWCGQTVWSVLFCAAWSTACLLGCMWCTSTHWAVQGQSLAGRHSCTPGWTTRARCASTEASASSSPVPSVRPVGPGGSMEQLSSGLRCVTAMVYLQLSSFDPTPCPPTCRRLGRALQGRAALPRGRQPVGDQVPWV